MFYEYLKELYIRIFFCLYTFIGCFFSIFTYREEYFYWYSGKVWNLLSSGYFIFTGISEVFLSYLSLSFVLSVYIFLWMLIINIFLYILPGMYRFEAKKILKILLINLTTFSIFFGYLHGYGLNTFATYLLNYKTLSGLGGFELNFEPRFSEFIYFIYKVDLIILLTLGIFSISLWYINSSIEKQFVSVIYKWRKYIYIIIFLLIVILFPADIFLHTFVFVSLGIIFEIACFLLCIKKSIEFNR